MQRPIKFRAWEPLNQKIHYMQLALIDEHGNFATKPSIEARYRTMNLDALIIEQFTGLLDKNGKEIYEGDIVMFNHVVTKQRIHHGQYVVQRIDGAFWLTDPTGPVAGVWEVVGSTVIGNIHENPGLIESGANAKEA